MEYFQKKGGGESKFPFRQIIKFKPMKRIPRHPLPQINKGRLFLGP